MNLVVRQPVWKELSVLSNRLNRMFDLPRAENDDFLGARSPAVDIYDKGSEVVIHADVPGLKKDDIDIRVENNVLSLRGERKFENETKREDYHRVERAYGSFSRSFALPNAVDTEKIQADYKDGVLNVTLPQKEEAKPKQISISTAK